MTFQSHIPVYVAMFINHMLSKPVFNVGVVAVPVANPNPNLVLIDVIKCCFFFFFNPSPRQLAGNPMV